MALGPGRVMGEEGGNKGELFPKLWGREGPEFWVQEQQPHSHPTPHQCDSWLSSPPVSAAAGVGAGPGSSAASPALQCPYVAILCEGSWAVPELERWTHDNIP